MLDISFPKSASKKSDTAILFVYANARLSGPAKTLDKGSGGLISQAVKTHAGFKGKPGQSLSVSLPAKAGFSRALLCGLGKPEELNALKAEETGGRLYPALKKSGAVHASILADPDIKLKDLKSENFHAHFVAGLNLRAYVFEHYKKPKNDDQPDRLKKIEVAGPGNTNIAKAYKPLSHVIEGIFLARDLVNEPPNILHPETYAVRIRDELKPLGVDVEIFDEKKLEKLKMGGILAVGMGSDFPPRMVIMRWKGKSGGKGKSMTKPLALVGKGVTFDSGGISIKPGHGMEEMKMDMAGSAAVVGAMKAIALSKVKTDIVAIVGLAENMPSARAYRPADIITSYAGKTIEIFNTDAEGRLVLVDALAYIQDTYKPRAVVDLATLTGAMMVALGHEYCGTFVNHDELWSELETAGKETGEKLWRMPLDDVWTKSMESHVADVQNLSKLGRFGGACTAAGFLEHFIDEGLPWAHMDIAGTAWIKSDKPTTPKQGTGFGVRVLHHLAEQYSKKK